MRVCAWACVGLRVPARVCGFCTLTLLAKKGKLEDPFPKWIWETGLLRGTHAHTHTHTLGEIRGSKKGNIEDSSPKWIWETGLLVCLRVFVCALVLLTFGGDGRGA